MRATGAIMAGLVVLFGTGPAAAAEPSGARAFIESVYAGYPRSTPRTDAEYYGMFDRRLRALIVRNDNYDPNEVGPLDGDPICNCQEDAGFSHAIVSVDGQGSRATVLVRNLFGPPAPVSDTPVTYRLVRQDGRWRIADIATAGQPSFRRWLESELARPR